MLLKIKFIFLFILQAAIFSILIYSCSPAVDKSYNNSDKLLAVICINQFENPTVSKNDTLFLLCFQKMDKDHKARVNKDGGLNCSKCHKKI